MLKGICLPWSKEEEGTYIFGMKQVPVTCNPTHFQKRGHKVQQTPSLYCYGCQIYLLPWAGVIFKQNSHRVKRSLFFFQETRVASLYLQSASSSRIANDLFIIYINIVTGWSRRRGDREWGGCRHMDGQGKDRLNNRHFTI